MKRHWIALFVVCLAIGLMVAPALAQPRPGGGGNQGGRGGRYGGGGGFSGMYSRGGSSGDPFQDYTREIPDLTDGQRREIANIRRAAIERFKELEKRMNEDIKKALTREQAQIMDDIQYRSTHRGPGGIIMTEEQKKVWDEARAAAAGAEGEKRSQIYREAYEKIRESSTEEQTKAAEDERAARTERFREMMRQRQAERDRDREGGDRPAPE